MANRQTQNIDRKSFANWLDKELIEPSPTKGLFKNIQSINAIQEEGEEQEGFLDSIDKQYSENSNIF